MAARKPRYTIGLILSNASNDFSGHLIEEMEEKFEQKGYQLLITLTSHNVEKEKQMLQYFSKITDGIIIVSDAVSYGELADFVPKKLPVIFLNRKPEGCPKTCIIENDYSAVYQAVLSNSRRDSDKIAFICNHSEFSTTKEILRAYRNAMLTTPAGLDEDLIYCRDTVSVKPNEIIPEILSKKCNTIFTTTQTLTAEYLDYLLLYNRNHSNAISLIGFSNKESSRQTQLSIDTITQPLQQLVDLSVQQMLYLINYPNTPAREYLIKGSLRMRVHDVLN